MAQSKGHKQFPFKWRAAWLALGRANPTAAYVWDYMFWRSDKDDIFDLEESLVCKDTGLERKTLCKARSLIAKHGGFRRLYSRNPQGQLIVKYQMLGFEEGEQVPENGTSNKSQQTGLEPSTVLRDSVKRDHTVDTPSVDTSNQEPVDTRVREKGRKVSPPLASLATSQLAESLPNPTPNELRVFRALALAPSSDSLNDLRQVYENIQSYNSIIGYWNWNQSHQPDRLVFYDLNQVLRSLTEGQKRGFSKYLKHSDRPCPVCKKLNGGKDRKIVEYDSNVRSTCFDCDDDSCDNCLAWLEDHPPVPDAPQSDAVRDVFSVESPDELAAKAGCENHGRAHCPICEAEPRQAFEIECVDCGQEGKGNCICGKKPCKTCNHLQCECPRRSLSQIVGES